MIITDQSEAARPLYKRCDDISVTKEPLHLKPRAQTIQEDTSNVRFGKTVVLITRFI